MANNPMQRKANMYLFIGIFVTLLITGSIIGIITMQFFKLKKEIDTEHADMKAVAVANKDIRSGETLTEASITYVKVPSSAAPSNSAVITSTSTIESNTTNSKKVKIAKIDLKKGTTITENMIYEEGEETSNDIRTQEYNTVILPSQIADGDYIDIRLRLPNGTDYIVVSKKKVTIPLVGITESANTIKLDVTENEILLMSNAIVEAYWVNGSMLYATTYKEPGMQEDATPTYLPNNEVATLISTDPNIVSVAKDALIKRYNETSGTVRTDIVNSLNKNAEKGQTNVENGVQEEINKAKQERQNYLQSLGGY